MKEISPFISTYEEISGPHVFFGRKMKFRVPPRPHSRALSNKS